MRKVTGGEGEGVIPSRKTKTNATPTIPEGWVLHLTKTGKGNGATSPNEQK